MLPRIRRLLEEELEPPLPYEIDQTLECDERDCKLRDNPGCLRVALQELLDWLIKTRPFESYVINLSPV